MNIAFCINRLALLGFGPTLSSLIRNCSKPFELNIFIYCSSLSESDKQNIQDLLIYEKFGGTYEITDFDPKIEFGTFKSLHGDWTTYGRLLLGDLMDQSSVVYLDADLIIEVDILALANFDFRNKTIAAVKSGPVKFALENNLYVNKLGLSPESDSFNAGVLMIDLVAWRQQDIKSKCIDFARRYPNDILSCDQPILNGLFAGDFAFLPDNFNCSWFAGAVRPNISMKMILHFVGSPKPWDPLAKMVHSGVITWSRYLTPKWKDIYSVTDYRIIRRLWHIRRSYLKAIKNVFKEKSF